jgi:hypothetical protein
MAPAMNTIVLSSDSDASDFDEGFDNLKSSQPKSATKYFSKAPPPARGKQRTSPRKFVQESYLSPLKINGNDLSLVGPGEEPSKAESDDTDYYDASPRPVRKRQQETPEISEHSMPVGTPRPNDRPVGKLWLDHIASKLPVLYFGFPVVRAVLLSSAPL